MLTLTFTADVPADLACLSTDDEQRTGRGLAVPFGVASGPSSSDGHRYRFTTPPDNLDELVDVVREHDDDRLVGRLAAAWEQTKDGLLATARFFDTTAGRDAFTEAKEGARRGFSVKAGIKKFTTSEDGVRDVTSWDAAHLGIVRRPAFDGAGIQFSAAAHTPKEHSTMTDTTPDVAQLAQRVLDMPAVAELTEKVNAMPTVAELAEKVAEQLDLDNAPTHPLAAFASADEFYAAFQEANRAGDDEKVETLQAAFAVPDQTTSKNPGVIPPAWRTDIKKRIDKRTPAIRAFGSIGLPDNGMDVTWPYLDPALDIDAIIQQQVTEKTELQGVEINILKASQGIKTAGAVSDISYQLLMRSAPSYLAAHNEILLAAWARYLEAKFEAQLLALGTDSGEVAPTTVADLRTRLFERSAEVEDATGSPADVVLVSTDLWSSIGGMPELYNSKYGTNNVAGTSSASTLQIDVNGLKIERAPFFPTGTMLVGSSDAAKASNSGARVATAEDVRKLGRDVAVWGMYTDGEVYMPAGVRIDNPAV